MTDDYLLNLRTFREVEDSKAQALKPLEEAAEAFGAWRELDSMRSSPFLSAWRDMRDDLIDGCLDTVQATVNLLAAVGARRARSTPPSGAWTRGTVREDVCDGDFGADQGGCGRGVLLRP